MNRLILNPTEAEINLWFMELKYIESQDFELGIKYIMHNVGELYPGTAIIPLIAGACEGQRAAEVIAKRKEASNKKLLRQPSDVHIAESDFKPVLKKMFKKTYEYLDKFIDPQTKLGLEDFTKPWSNDRIELARKKSKQKTANRKKYLSTTNAGYSS